MATVKFRIKGKDKKTNSIYMYVSAGRGKFFEVKTSLSIDPDHWNFKKGLPKTIDAQSKQVMIRLKELDSYIYSALAEATFKGEEIGKIWLQMKIDECFNRVTFNDENLLTTNIQNIIDTAHTKVVKGKKGIGLSLSRVKGYQTFLGIVKQYEAFSNKLIVMGEISKPFLESFVDWMRVRQKYSIGYSGKQIDNLKSVCNDARSNGVAIHQFAFSIQSFTESDEDRFIVTLSFAELNKIRDAVMPTESLENVKKWILVGCFMGQRGADLLKVDFKKYEVIQNGLIFNIRQQKGQKEVSVPIAKDYVIDIIKNNPPYPISIQKLNNYMKEVCEIAGIDEIVRGYKIMVSDGMRRKVLGNYPKWEIVSSHSFRRSFATNLYPYFPARDVMSVTGHTRESTFLSYINKNIDKKEDLERLMTALDKLSTEGS
jgi:integrase